MVDGKFSAKISPQDDAVETLSITAIVLILLLAFFGALSLVGKVVVAMEPVQQAHVDAGNNLSGR